MQECQQALDQLKYYLTSPVLPFPQLGDQLLLFFAISVSVVGTVWMKEVGSDHLCVYYVSKVSFLFYFPPEKGLKRRHLCWLSCRFHNRVQSPFLFLNFFLILFLNFFPPKRRFPVEALEVEDVAGAIPFTLQFLACFGVGLGRYCAIVTVVLDLNNPFVICLFPLRQIIIGL